MNDMNIKSSTIEKSLDMVKDFLNTLIGPPVKEIGELLADNVKHWRLKNQIKNLQKVQKIIDEEGVQARQLNMKILFPYLEAVSLEEEEVLQDLWANLLANYIDPSKNLQATVYPEILRQLSGRDVEILESYYAGSIQYDQNKRPIPTDFTVPSYTPEELSNLERLGLLEAVFQQSTAMYGSVSYFMDQYSQGAVKVTVFGDQFYKACHRNK